MYSFVMVQMKFHALFVMAHMEFHALFVMAHMELHAFFVMAQSVTMHFSGEGEGWQGWQYLAVPPNRGTATLDGALLIRLSTPRLVRSKRNQVDRTFASQPGSSLRPTDEMN
jgi:hypothetical protein